MVKACDHYRILRGMSGVFDCLFDDSCKTAKCCTTHAHKHCQNKGYVVFSKLLGTQRRNPFLRLQSTEFQHAFAHSLTYAVHYVTTVLDLVIKMAADSA